MRHLRSIMYALVLAPAVWILCGVGFDQDLTGRARDNGGIESLSGVLLLLLAGAAYAILLFAPISPAGPALAGLVFAVVGAWARIAPESYAGVWPANIAKEGFDVSTPGYGLAVLLAVPLLCTALSARRWRAFEPPQILLIGTIGGARGAARVAGTPMAAEPTSVIPQQRQAPRMPPPLPQPPYPQPPLAQPPLARPPLAQPPLAQPPLAQPPLPQPPLAPVADTTQIVVHAEPTVTIPAGGGPQTTVLPVDDDGDEKTTVMRLGAPPELPTTVITTGAAPAPAEEATTILGAGDGPTEDVAEAEGPTEAVTGTEEPTETVAEAEEPTEAVTGTEEPTEAVTGDLTGADDPTEVVSEVEVPTAGEAHPAEETTSDSAGSDGEATTRLVPPDPDGSDSGEKTQVLRLPAEPAPPTDATDSGEQTQVLRVPTADGLPTPALDAADSGEKTQVIRVGTVEPPADRTEVLTLPAPGEATVANPAGEKTEETTRAMSIAGSERPDPGADPTTPLGVPAAAATGPSQDRRAMTVTNLERPADEAADDTLPTVLDTPDRPTPDDTTAPPRQAS
ncbi:hypothetical protein [Actinoplanes sp. NPDC049118]|uniref:hypothetical protein n=1 Tax=Actinoplanes sp. NPDC049118 TaxID=3155769 RepID=UPI0033C2278F